MDFEDFLKKINSDINPDKAYKLYMQVKLNILEELIVSNTGVTRESINNIENQVFARLIEMLKNK